MSTNQVRVLCEELQHFIIEAELQNSSRGLQAYIQDVKQILIRHMDWAEEHTK